MITMDDGKGRKPGAMKVRLEETTALCTAARLPAEKDPAHLEEAHRAAGPTRPWVETSPRSSSA